MKKKLTENDVRFIREAQNEKAKRLPIIDAEIKRLKAERIDVSRGFSRAALAKKFKVSKSCIQFVVEGYNWRHVV